MIRAFLLALALAGVSSAADAQTVQVVSSCGTLATPVGPGGRQTVDQAGNLCIAAGMGDLASAGAGGVSSFSRIPLSSTPTTSGSEPRGSPIRLIARTSA